jgi:zinc protease
MTEPILPAAPFVPADIKRASLPNGLVCLVRSTPGLGAVVIHGYVRAGAAQDNGRSGLARFVSSMLLHGTARRSAQQIAIDLDSAGASLTFGSGIESTIFAGRALSSDLPLLIALAVESLTMPAFPSDELERVRGELVTAARVSALDTRHVAERLFRRLAYPHGHPHREMPDGEESVLASLTPRDLGSFHRDNFRPDGTVLAIVGDVDSEHAIDRVTAAFGGWSASGTRPDRSSPAAAAPPTRLRQETALPGKTQSDIVLGVHGVARGDPDYYNVMMANLLLGQLGLMGRIGQNVRERQGMAYYAYSDLRAGLSAGPWWVRAGVNPTNVERAVSAILHEITTLQDQGPDSDELEDARTYLIGSLAVRLETSQGIAQTLADIEFFNLGLDYLERYPGIIRGINRDDIVAAVRRFTTDRYALAIAGPERAS